MRIAILEHDADAPAGYFAEWATANGHTFSVLGVPELERWPAPDAYDLVVSLGSERSVHASSDAWIRPEIEFLREAHQLTTPVFGICFGGQALAAALGGRVSSAPRPRAEWREIETSDRQLISPGPWLRWHNDIFELPEGASRLAGSSSEPLAFLVGNSVGLQFHPEATPEIVEGWMETGHERLVEQQIDEQQLRDEVRHGAVGARSRAFELFDAFSAVWRRSMSR